MIFGAAPCITAGISQLRKGTAPAQITLFPKYSLANLQCCRLPYFFIQRGTLKLESLYALVGGSVKIAANSPFCTW